MQSRRRLNLSITLKSSQQMEDLEVDIGTSGRAHVCLMLMCIMYVCLTRPSVLLQPVHFAFIGPLP